MADGGALCGLASRRPAGTAEPRRREGILSARVRPHRDAGGRPAGQQPAGQPAAELAVRVVPCPEAGLLYSLAMPPRRPAAVRESPAPPEQWLLLIYRVPSESSRARVAVWRDLKRLGGLYLQQAVCVLPDREDVRRSVARIRARIDELGGSSVFITLRDIEMEVRDQFVAGFRSNSEKEYAEIIEECETKFVKEIEFERFRQNYSFEEAEEIRQDLEKLRRWLAKVEGRDWMHADGRTEARDHVARCAALLEQFEADVYERATGHDSE